MDRLLSVFGDILVLSMDWKSGIGGFQVLAGIWVPRTENGLETVTVICF